MYNSEYETDRQLQHPIIQRHRKLLQKLSIEERVFGILFNEPDKFCILEYCDEYFGYHPTKADALELSELFREIAEVLPE